MSGKAVYPQDKKSYKRTGFDRRDSPSNTVSHEKLRDAYGMIKFDRNTLADFRSEILPVLSMWSEHSVPDFEALYIDEPELFQVLIEEVMFGISLILSLREGDDFREILEIVRPQIIPVPEKYNDLRDQLLLWCGTHEMCPIRREMMAANISSIEIENRVDYWKQFMNSCK